jgi:hypothetical protein
MKTIVTILLLGVLLFASPSEAVKAGAFPGYTSGFQVQNLSSNAATISIDYYNPDGTTATTATDTIPANGSKTYFPIHAASGFNGSVVISSDQQIASVVNVLTSTGARAGASYVAALQGGTTVSLPLLMKNNSGFNTWFHVQNTGTSDANITVNYSDGTSATASIKPGAAKLFDQSTEPHTASVFSANITSNEPVAAAVMEESSTVMFAYTGFMAGSPNPVMPLVNANNNGYVTGIQIQNIGTQPTDVTLSYTPSAAGSACTETQTIPAGQSKTFALAAFANGSNSNCVPGAKFIGAASVTTNSTNQPLVAIVNQLLPGVNGEAYGSFNPANATNKVVMPLIMDRNSGWFTGFNVMNVGSSSTTVTCTFTGTSYTVSGTLNPGQALTDIQNNKINNGYVGSGTCTASNPTDKIVAVVNELNPSAGDNLLVYEGINQ